MEEVAERFLEVEAAVPPGTIDPMDRARFARLVRQCAAKWMLHPRVTLRTSRSKHGMALQFEGPLGGKSFPIFSLRADHAAAEYSFEGPNPDRKRLELQENALAGLARLRDLYEALLAGNAGAGELVTVVLKGPRMPDLVPLVEETRKALDGGTETVTPPPPRAVQPTSLGTVKSRTGTKRIKAENARQSSTSPAPTKPRPPSSSSDLQACASGLVALRFACPDPKACIAFYQRVLKLEPAVTSEDGESAIFELGPVLLTLDGALTKEERSLFGYSGSPKPQGEGLILYLAVDDFDLCRRRSRRMKTAIIAEDLKSRRFTIRDPAGYITTITESSR